MSKISLTNTKVSKLTFNQIDEITDSTDDFSFGYKGGFSEQKENSFIIIFNLGVKSLDGYSLEIEFVAFFESDEPVDEFFMGSHFAKVNAPAIAYPFLRSYISNLTLQSGYEPFMLPTINFQALANKIPS